MNFQDGQPNNCRSPFVHMIFDSPWNTAASIDSFSQFLGKFGPELCNTATTAERRIDVGQHDRETVDESVWGRRFYFLRIKLWKRVMEISSSLKCIASHTYLFVFDIAIGMSVGRVFIGKQIIEHFTHLCIGIGS